VTDIYDAGHIEKLYDEMAGTCETVNYITSSGFSKRWCRQFAHTASVNLLTSHTWMPDNSIRA